jgi:hypothetical protein
MCGRKDPLWHNRRAEKLIWVKTVKAILRAKDGESVSLWVEADGRCHVVGGDAEYLLALVLNMRCAMRDVDPPTPLAAGFGLGLLLCEPVGVLVV